MQRKSSEAQRAKWRDYKNQPVHPETGEYYSGPGAITYGAWQKIQPVHPDTGKPYTGDGWITYGAWRNSRPVHRDTGAPIADRNDPKKVTYKYYCKLKRKREQAPGEISEVRAWRHTTVESIQALAKRKKNPISTAVRPDTDDDDSVSHLPPLSTPPFFEPVQAWEITEETQTQQTFSNEIENDFFPVTQNFHHETSDNLFFDFSSLPTSPLLEPVQSRENREETRFENYQAVNTVGLFSTRNLPHQEFLKLVEEVKATILLNLPSDLGDWIHNKSICVNDSIVRLLANAEEPVNQKIYADWGIQEVKDGKIFLNEDSENFLRLLQGPRIR